MGIRLSWFFVILILNVTFMGCTEKRSFIETKMLESGEFKNVLSNPEKYRLQIIYTQIDRLSDNSPVFTTHRFRVDEGEYLYPASTVKLPMALLALEKINTLGIPGLTPQTSMVIDSLYDWQTKVETDTTSADGKPSVGHAVRKIFLVSDNEAYNWLYEFVGQRESNAVLRTKGYGNIRIAHRLSVPLTPEQNRLTAPVRFFHGDTVVYSQPEAFNTESTGTAGPRPIGRAYYSGDSLMMKPMDFSDKNVLGLEDLHTMLRAVLFPESVDAAQRFNLSEADYAFLYKAMAQYPNESGIPRYDHYDDGYCKFFMYGGAGSANKHVRIFNKVGEAYGFLIDMAYVVDFEKKIEFMIGAVIYVNEDEILNDGTYEYDSIGFPFFRDLGRLFYDHELTRQKTILPDLTKFNFESWKN